ncbi:MAG TPA: glycoside hydrolase family 88 protein [Draconibacterium sp.]|nr:glycoside hydrolase family 88 protein [Draconibacterium sp.]
MKKNFSSLVILLLIALVTSAGNKDTQKLFADKQIKKVMQKTLDWQLKHPKHQLYDWTNGAFYAGVFAAYETTQSPKIWDALVEMGEANEWKPGPRLKHADDHVICQTYIDMYRVSHEKKMVEPFAETMVKFMKTPFQPEGIQKITWWWCDALFMAPPAFVKLGVTLGQDEYLEITDKLWRETYDMLWDKDNHLYARDLSYKWNEPDIEPKKEANGEKIFWSRGNGWVMGGLVRTLTELPSDYPNRDFYLQNYKEMAARIIELQQEDGLWRASLLDPESYPGGEASGSGFYTYALAWGINNGILDRETYLPVVEKAWIALNGLIQKDGRVGWCQPIGADPKKNFNAESWEVYGAGAFLLAGSEVIKLND